jgi:cobalt-zinc-cadmium efflux system membrane fusion protein
MTAQQHFQATIEGIRGEGLRRLAPQLRSYRARGPLLGRLHAMMTRGLLLTAAMIAAAAGLGFAVGHSRSIATPHLAPLAAAPITVPTTAPLSATVAVSGDELANLQIHLGHAENGPLIRTITATGTVGYDQLRLIHITPPARGRIQTLDVVVGDPVAAGQRLAVLDNFELSAVRSQVAGAEAAVSQARAQVATAHAAFVRAANLVRIGGMAQSVLDARRATAAGMEAELRTREAQLHQYREQQLRLMPTAPSSNRSGTYPRESADAQSIAAEGPPDSRSAIVAPFKGLVDSVSATPGELVDPSTQIFTVADLSTVWVQADVAASDLGAIQVGDTAQVTVSAYPGRIFTGRVIYISDKIDPMTGTAKVRCAIPNPDSALRVNMFASISINSPLGRNAVLVPSSTLQDVNGQSVVFIPAGHGRFTWRPVHTGLVANGQTQITGGLDAGTPVVTAGSYWLKAVLMRSTIPDEG